MPSDNEKQQLEPAILVIFGITGDLAQRKLLPALYHLIKDDLIHEKTNIVGVSRHHVDAKDILKKVELCVLDTDETCDAEVLDKFSKKLRMIQLDPVNGEDYGKLQGTLNDIEEKRGLCMNRLFYLAIPPQVYGPVIKNMGEHHLQDGCPHNVGVSRLLVEKPFGYDLTSAAELIEETTRFFKEKQIFRIDHYLAKETAQNILTFREHNPAFLSSWDNNHISNITIVAGEKIGVEGRGSFYDNVGALRDIVQSHLLQLLTLVTMEIPKNIHDSRQIHESKRTLLEHVKPVDMNQNSVVRGQYNGYREEVQSPYSATETFVRIALDIDDNRWRGVPISIMTGKALSAKRTTIAITFSAADTPSANILTFRIQPNEGIDIELAVKRPGFEDKLEIVKMDFSYHGVFGEPTHPDAYERVLVDAVRGDRTLFATGQEVMLSWRILQPILDAWSLSDDDLQFYEQNSEGIASS